MDVTLQEFCQSLDILFTPHLIPDNCPNGLQVEGKGRIKSVATAVSASLETIEGAVAAGVDALVVHHGLFWERDPYPVVGVRRKKLEALLKAGLSLFAYHLPMDAHPTLGNNWKVAIDLKWSQCTPFGIYKGTAIGVKGEFDPMPIEQFQHVLEQYYMHPAHVALGGPKEVRSVGLISGGAYRSIEEAALAGVDCFITGNFDEPAWHMARELGVNFLALGHNHTERVGPMALAKHIQRTIGIPATFLDYHNPF